MQVVRVPKMPWQLLKEIHGHWYSNTMRYDLWTAWWLYILLVNNVNNLNELRYGTFWSLYIVNLLAFKAYAHLGINPFMKPNILVAFTHSTNTNTYGLSSKNLQIIENILQNITKVFDPDSWILDDLIFYNWEFPIKLEVSALFSAFYELTM